MQEPTHILTGVIIQRVFGGIKPRALGLGLTATMAFLSHGFLDELARVTYHPPQLDFHGPFWVGYHAAVVVTSIVFLFLWWKNCKWGIVFAVLPDVDWIFIHGQEIFHFDIFFYRQPHLHNLLHFIYQRIPPFSRVTPFLNRLPDHRHNPWACLWEALLVAVLLLILHLTTMAKRPAARLAKLQET